MLSAGDTVGVRWRTASLTKGRSVKIVDVKFHRLSYPLEEPFSNSRVWCKARTAGVVEVETDAGHVGWGESVGPLPEPAAREYLMGRDPFEVERIWRDLRLLGLGGIAAISAVDIALWDLMGKALDRPIYALLGGAFRDKIPAYASGLFNKDRADITQALADEARGYVDQGFGAVKMKIGLGEAYDVKNVAAVRRAIGDGVRFAVDANCGYDAATAIDVGRKIAAADLYWFEEPVAPDDLEGYRKIRRDLPMRIAGGEQLAGRWAFRDPIQRGALDIVQPDISIAGGFSECRKIQAMASANQVRLLPHMWGTSIRLAATLHWQATIPDEPQALNPEPCLFEFDMTENGLRTGLAKEPIEAIDGHVAVPQAPGLGIEIDREVLARYSK